VTRPCAFCAIAQDGAPARRVLETEESVAFLDARPLFPGHVLVVPRAHHETLGELPPDLVAPLFRDVRRIVLAVEKALDAPGTFVAANNRVSQSVPHLHVHVVPRRPKDGLRGFFWPRTPYPDDAAADAVRDAIADAVR
jgi:histidine triad (HIT) family protein